jgi:hypothetical protein
MIVANRAAENGSEIINDAINHVFSKSHPPIAIRILEETVITVLSATNVVNVAYYTGKTMAVTDPVILGNFTGIHLTSGAVQAIY